MEQQIQMPLVKRYNYPKGEQIKEICTRPDRQDKDITNRVMQIVERVRCEGDAALYALNKEIDGSDLKTLAVTAEEIQSAVNRVGDELKAAIAVAYANITAFHEKQKSPEVDIFTMPGVRCVQRAVPINRVGLYIPGGTAPLFSTVLMLAIPAQIAGCQEVIMCTPADKNGKIADEILYAAQLCGVTCIYKLGGAQAIAAMALGTETIEKVYKIFGPGNRYVTKAKQLLSQDNVAIDMPAGPSEVLVMADASADPEFVAADMLSQAEHGIDSQVVLLSVSQTIITETVMALARQLELLPRAEIARQTLLNSKIVLVDSFESMIRLTNTYAPEHLIIATDNPWDIANQITNAGSVFIGNYSPESVGDYASGTNHTLPTNGWAKSFNGVNLDSFMRKLTYQELSPEGLSQLGNHVIRMAQAEQLDAHANAVSVRLNKITR